MVEDGLAASAGSQVDEKCPGCAGWDGGGLVGGLEVQGVGVVVCYVGGRLIFFCFLSKGRVLLRGKREYGRA